MGVLSQLEDHKDIWKLSRSKFLHLAITSSLEHKVYAEALAARLDLPFVTNENNMDGVLFVGDRLELRLKNIGIVYVDFLKGKAAWRRRFGGGKNQALAKAVGIKGSYRPSIIDATAGLGQDAFVFASLGCKVILIEHSPIIGALLADGLKRARKDSEVEEVISRMHLHLGDANQLISNLPRQEVIYLDPMYPMTSKSSLPKKGLQALRTLQFVKSDEEKLFYTAREYAQTHVVVKRPKGAPCIAKITPEARITTKSTRFDVYKQGKSFYE